MHIMILIYFRYIAMTLMLFTLSACGTMQSMYEEVPSFFQTSKTHEVSPLEQKLRELDLANDREAARNAFLEEMIDSSDKICDKHKQQILSDSEQWEIYSKKGGLQFEKLLKEAISLRQFDPINTDVTILSMHEAEATAYAMATIITEAIDDTRKLARIQLKARMDDPIRQYPVKQGLLDLQAYHHSCSVQFAVGAVARASVGKMTPAKRNAAIDSLMQLRKKLMGEGLNTRVVQQKIDTLILSQ